MFVYRVKGACIGYFICSRELWIGLIILNVVVVRSTFSRYNEDTDDDITEGNVQL